MCSHLTTCYSIGILSTVIYLYSCTYCYIQLYLVSCLAVLLL